MRLLTYEQARDMPGNYLSSFVGAEIECWWSHPFDEFKKCDNPRCWALYSIEDVYWTVDEYRNRVKNVTLIDNFKCDECWDNTSDMYWKQHFLEVFVDYFNNQVSAILLLNDEDIVRWFWIVSYRKISDLISLELSTRLWSYNKDELLYLLSKNIYWVSNAWNDNVIFFNHLYLWQELRNTKYWWLVMQRLFKFVKFYDNKPSLIETMKNSEVYNFMLNSWYKELISDNYWYAIMYVDKDNCSYSSVFNNLKNSKRDKTNEFIVTWPRPLRLHYKDIE